MIYIFNIKLKLQDILFSLLIFLIKENYMVYHSSLGLDVKQVDGCPYRQGSQV